MIEANQPQDALPHGFMLANQTVLQRVGVDPRLGDRYTAFFGTTNRVYDVTIATGPGATAALREFEALLACVSRFRHPCLIPYFACGIHAGIAWIRSEHTEGAPDWVTASAPPAAKDAATEDGDVVCFPTLRALLDATGGSLAAKDRNVIIGDLAEVTAYLHDHEGHVGVIDSDTICLDKTFRHSSLMARFRYYAWPEATTPARQDEDLRQLAALIVTLVEASEGARPGRLGRALSRLAESLLAGEVALDARAFYEAVCQALEAGGDFHKPRTEKRRPTYAADGSVMEPLVLPQTPVPTSGGGSARRHRSAHHRHRSKPRSRRLDANSATGQMVAAVLRMTFLFLGIAGVGLGVYFAMRMIERRRQADIMLTGPRRYSAITIIEDEAERAAQDAFPADIRQYTPEQLKQASAFGNALATARLAVLTLAADPADSAAHAEAEAILSPHRSRLEVAALTDPEAAYWQGYVRLLGIGGRVDAEEAMALLERAVAGGYVDARILLGDWLASRSPERRAEDDRQALQVWRAAYDRPSKWTSTHFDAIARIIHFVRDARGFRPDDADLGSLVVHAASAGHPDAMLLAAELHEKGVLLEKNPSLALGWLRRLSANATLRDGLRAEVQHRMAGMFLQGRGTPASASAARIWYERAARLGHRPAMLALVALCETGQGAEGGKPSPEEARYWRKQAESAVDAAPIPRPCRLLPGAAPVPTPPASPDEPRTLNHEPETPVNDDRVSL